MNLPDLLKDIDKHKEEIDAFRPLDKEREARIWQKFRLDWNFHSNSIEGNSLTYGETKSFLLHGITAAGKPLKDHLDIRGHNEALQELTEIIREERPLTEALIRQIHETILPEPYDVPAITAEGVSTVKHIVPGRYKTSPNHVKTATGEIFYFATWEETPAKMEELINWFRKEKENPGLHPLILAAEFHYRFIRIHPFDDGNGRMARILMNLILMMKGFPPVIIKAQKKDEYLTALRQADGGDVQLFVIYIGEQLFNSMDLYLSGAKGEDIEEDDDVFKELHLLKKELKHGQKELIIQKDNYSIKKFIHESIGDLLYDLRLHFRELDDLFLSRKLWLQLVLSNAANNQPAFYINNDHQDGALNFDINTEYAIAALFIDLETIFIDSKLSEIMFDFAFCNFKYKPNDTFNIDVRLHIKLSKVYYELSIGNDVVAKNYYQESLTIEQIKTIRNNIIKSVLEAIKQNTNTDSK